MQVRPELDSRAASGALLALLVLAVFYTLYFAAPLLIPLTLALLMSLMLSPAVSWLEHRGLPRGVGAALVLGLLLGLLFGAVYTLSTPAAQWLENAPEHLEELDQKLRFLIEPLSELKAATQNVEALASPQTFRDELEVKVRSPGMLEALLKGAPSLAVGLAITGVLLFFLLQGGDNGLRKLVNLVPGFANKRLVVETVRALRHDIAIYLVTITLINLALGCAAALVLWLLGMPNALLWGSLVGVLNFMPYIGPMISVVVIALAALLGFDTVLLAVLAPALVATLTTVEGQLVTPSIAGRNLALSPVAAFLMLVLMSWVWGALGALMAIPLLASIRIASERIEPLWPVARILMHPRLRAPVFRQR